jgi:hypothetical protein
VSTARRFEVQREIDVPMAPARFMKISLWVARASEIAEKDRHQDRSVWSRLGKQLILRNADSEPRP